MKTYKQLTFEQRYAIETMLKSGLPKLCIAQSIGASESTIYRETDRNKKPRGNYRASYA
jgi:IS30 family transposase